MDLRHLRYFVAVAEELHFGRAAEKLHISQPPLSHQIRDLERDLGVELFHRTRHFVALTDAGRLFLDEARHVLGEAERAVSVARKAGRGEIGRLSVGFGPAPENGVLRRVLAMFLSRHPDISLDLHNLYTTEQIEALANGRIQVGFPLLPISHRDLVVEAIGSEPLVVAFPAEHPLACTSQVDLADLRNEPFVRLSPDLGVAFCDLVTGSCRESGFNPHVAHEAGHLITVLGFVAAGLGVAILPGTLSNVGVEGVAFRPLRRGPSVNIGIAFRRNESSRTLSSFLEVVRVIARQRRLRSVRKTANA